MRLHGLTPVSLLSAVGMCWAGVASPALAQTGDDIIDRALDALGGAAALEATRSVALEATMTLSGEGLTIELAMKYFIVRPDKLRIELSAESLGAESIEATDGTDFWTSENQRVSDMPPDKVAQFRRNFQSILPGMSFGDLRESGVVFEYLGRQSLRGVDVHRVRQTQPGDDASSSQASRSDWFFSVESGLPVALATSDPDDEEGFIWFEDYRRVGMFVMPFRWEMNVADAGSVTLSVVNVETNKPIDPSLFKRPG